MHVCDDLCHDTCAVDQDPHAALKHEHDLVGQAVLRPALYQIGRYKRKVDVSYPIEEHAPLGQTADGCWLKEGHPVVTDREEPVGAREVVRWVVYYDDKVEIRPLVCRHIAPRTRPDDGEG